MKDGELPSTSIRAPTLLGTRTLATCKLQSLSRPRKAEATKGTDAFVTQLGTAVSLSVQGQLTQGTNQQGFISAGNQATFTYTIQNSGPDLANNITVIDNISSSVTGVPVTFNSASVSSGTCGGVSTNSIVSCSLPQLQADRPLL